MSLKVTGVVTQTAQMRTVVRIQAKVMPIAIYNLKIKAVKANFREGLVMHQSIVTQWRKPLLYYDQKMSFI